MSCPLTQGFDYECDDSMGGIKNGTIKITQTENIDSFTVVDGEVTVLTQVALTNFYEYKINKEVASLDAPDTLNEEAGTWFVEAVLSFTMNKISKEKSTEFKLLASKPVTIIFQDMEDNWIVIGIDSGARKVGGTNSMVTGKVSGDMNGYNLGFTSKEKHYPYTVDATVVAGLTIA